MRHRAETERLPRRVVSFKSELAKSPELRPLREAAALVERDFAIQILMAAWTDTFHEDRHPFDPFRPAMKRALVAVARSSAQGGSKAARDLAVVAAAALEDHRAELSGLSDQ